MMLGYLLARRGVQVTVIEKHKDFFRDFRGDTVHPSTLELFWELGLLDDFLKVPHQELKTTGGTFGDFSFVAADFRKLPTHCKFVALMPQWDFLNFVAKQAREFPNFELRMEHEATGLIYKDARVSGVEVKTPAGDRGIEADLVVGCDGRHSTIRRSAQFEVQEFGVPIDVLWFRIRREPDDPELLLGNVNYGRALVLINRSTYFQAGFIIAKGSFPGIQATGIEAFRESITKVAPYLGDRVQELTDWDQVKLLTVQINRLRKWHRPGLLCIGDAAHAMSPAGGVGINLAIQDAVATSNLLGPALREGAVSDAMLATVQQRREFPVRVTQFFQAQGHRGMAQIFRSTDAFHAPWQLKALVQVPGIQHLFARAMGLGVRPEHIDGAPQKERGGILRKVALAAAGAAVAAGIICGLRNRPVSDDQQHQSPRRCKPTRSRSKSSNV